MEHTVFITGGAAGIGAATVEYFADKGWNVGFMDIDEKGENLARRLGSHVIFRKGDTRKKDDVEAAILATIEAFGPLGCVFANAGINRKNSILDISDDELRLIVDINIYGTANTLRSAIAHIIDAGGGSVVINASDQSLVGKYGSFAYGLTKGALGQMTKSLALDLADKGVRVNAVCPGTVRTPLVENIFNKLSLQTGKPVARYWEEENSDFPLGRIAEPSEIAAAVYFLASEDASFITGCLLPVDGGLTAR